MKPLLATNVCYICNYQCTNAIKKSPHLTSVIYENCPDVRYMDQFLEHPLSCSRKYMDLAPKSGVLAHLDSVELWCLGKKKIRLDRSYFL